MLEGAKATGQDIDSLFHTGGNGINSALLDKDENEELTKLKDALFIVTGEDS